MQKYILNQAAYPPLSIVLSLVVAGMFNFIVPREWANSPGAQFLISAVSTCVPALSELTSLLSPEKKYIAMTGAAIWRLTPIFLVMALLACHFDPSFSPNAKKSAEKLTIENRNSVFAFVGLIAVDVILAAAAFCTVWKSSGHFGPVFFGLIC